MNKVMTRTQHHPGTRPPGRRDTRRPTGTPPRTPNGVTPRPSPHSTRPPTAPGTTSPTGTATRTRHADGRPATTQALTPPTVPAQTPRRPLSQPRPTDLFADRLLAVLTGQRPVHFMLRHTLGHAYDDLAHLAERGPLRSTAHSARPVVRDIGYFVPRTGAIEAFARISAGDRLRAMAFRLELGTDRRWRCTAVELDGPRRPHPQDD
ncbi:Rv3235 family protein [Streptomyces sp. NBC_01485]|uniref:Rv3235 family protein n=1 Tax=Streptomyces sp. NBC_01485 TaxID=2903884 RepID=UPI002E32F298|nr:Rv3235 family protein [Streptomyces sp. NBC_01485]